MKRKVISLIFCLLLITSLVLPASANTSFVQDFANLVTSEERKNLAELAQNIQNIYDLDVVILTTPQLYGHPAQDFADDFYDNNGYRENGLLFLLDIGSRQWHISTAGTAIELLSDRDLMDIENRVIPYFSEGQYYDGFCRFLDILPNYLAVESEPGVNLFLSMVAGAAIAGIVIFIMRASMNTRRPQRSADSYQTEGSYHLRANQDLFLYSNISKRPRPQNNSSGSSTHRSSSGRSHGGRGGGF